MTADEPPPDNEPDYDWLGEMFAAGTAPIEDAAADPRPRDLEAERAVLGSMMIAESSIETVTAILDGRDFWRPVHAVIFSAITRLFEAGQPPDPAAVAGQLSRDGDLLRVGGAPFLHTLTSEVFTASNAAYYADRVADCAARARLVDVSQRLAQLAGATGDDLGSVQERARQAVEDATKGREDAEAGAWASDIVGDVLASWETPAADGLSYPYLDLQEVTHGMRAGQMVIVAARPGQGKSTLAMDLARSAARAGVASLFVSLEMGRAELVTRMVCAEAGVRFTDVRDRKLTAADRLRLEGAEADVKKFPIRIEDRFGLTLGQIRSKAREIARTCELGLLIVDYLQLIEPADTRVSRREQVDAISRGLKGLAKELALPVLAVAQLNRGSEARTDKLPAMSDLRESGALEQDADAIMLIHRPDYYDFESPRSGEADLILAKHRNGPTATIVITHQLYFCRFSNFQKEA